MTPIAIRSSDPPVRGCCSGAPEFFGIVDSIRYTHTRSCFPPFSSFTPPLRSLMRIPKKLVEVNLKFKLAARFHSLADLHFPSATREVPRYS